MAISTDSVWCNGTKHTNRYTGIVFVIAFVCSPSKHKTQIRYGTEFLKVRWQKLYRFYSQACRHSGSLSGLPAWKLLKYVCVFGCGGRCIRGSSCSVGSTCCCSIDSCTVTVIMACRQRSADTTGDARRIGRTCLIPRNRIMVFVTLISLNSLSAGSLPLCKHHVYNYHTSSTPAS